MYLDFILDIAKVGDIINITTKEQLHEYDEIRAIPKFHWGA